LIKIIPVTDQLSGFKLLLEGSVDVVVGDRWVGTYILAVNNIKGVAIVAETIIIDTQKISHKESALNPQNTSQNILSIHSCTNLAIMILCRKQKGGGADEVWLCPCFDQRSEPGCPA
jgi:hypothetical protein